MVRGGGGVRGRRRRMAKINILRKGGFDGGGEEKSGPISDII